MVFFEIYLFHWSYCSIVGFHEMSDRDVSATSFIYGKLTQSTINVKQCVSMVTEQSQLVGYPQRFVAYEVISTSSCRCGCILFEGCVPSSQDEWILLDRSIRRITGCWKYTSIMARIVPSPLNVMPLANVELMERPGVLE